MFRRNIFLLKNIVKYHKKPVVIRRHQSSYDQNSIFYTFLNTWKQYPLPIWGGISVIGLVHYFRIRREHEQETQIALAEGRLQKNELNNSGDEPFKVRLYNAIPLDDFSRFMGNLSRKELPKWTRTILFSLYCKLFGVNIEEALIEDLAEYKTFNEFFRRRLKPGRRPIDQNAKLVSPCDAKVLHCGPITDEGQVEQVKGMTYSMEDFLGFNPREIKLSKDTHLVQITMYLAPGDYHCFHTPTDWKIEHRRHFKGKLLSVRPSVATWMPKLFSQNERVVYTGNYNNLPNCSSFFSFVAVGATNVGSIKIEMDPELNTNCKGIPLNECKVKSWLEEKNVSKGSFFGKLLLIIIIFKLRFQISACIQFLIFFSFFFLGEFNLGSTVVLIFEAPNDFQFNVHPGDTIRVGQKL